MGRRSGPNNPCRRALSTHFRVALARSANAMTVFTIGYEGLDLPRFVSLLTEHRIETVVDIRALPLSRKRGFSKRALAHALNLAGYAYVHQAALGCPKPVRARYRADGNWPRYTTGFLKHLQRQETAIAELCRRVRASRCALLCYEADFNFCHRSLVAEAVRNHCGAAIEHIRADTNGRRRRSARLPALKRNAKAAPARGVAWK